MKIFHAQGWNDYSNWIPNRIIVNNIKDADLLILEGGTDVDSHRYGEKRSKYAETPDTKRDQYEIELFKQAISLGIPILGICRGSQLICVLNHGKLVQHQPNPKRVHLIDTYDGKKITTTSSHHQAQYPFLLNKQDYKLIAWNTEKLNFHLDGEDKELSPEKEAEIVFYPKSKSLAIQGHPEWMNKHDDIKYYQNLVFNLLNNKL